MAAPNFNAERAAEALAAAALLSDEEAAKAHKVSRRSIYNWRARLREDEEFAALFATKLDEARERWKGKVSGALEKSIDFIRKSLDAMDPSDPKALAAAVEAHKLLAESDLVGKVIAERMNAGGAGQDRGHGAPHLKVVAGHERG